MAVILWPDWGSREKQRWSCHVVEEEDEREVMGEAVVVGERLRGRGACLRRRL